MKNRAFANGGDGFQGGSARVIKGTLLLKARTTLKQCGKPTQECQLPTPVHRTKLRKVQVTKVVTRRVGGI